MLTLGAGPRHPLAGPAQGGSPGGLRRAVAPAPGQPSPEHHAPEAAHGPLPHHVAPRLLVADENPTTCTFLQDNLTADGYHVDTAATSNDAFAYLRDAVPNLILVDVNGTTLALVDHVRAGEHGLCAAAPDTPIIALTAHSDAVHRVRLLDRGSDDVITKPFSYPELRARVEAILRRMAPRQTGAIVSAGPVRIDRRRHAVTVADRTVSCGAWNTSCSAPWPQNRPGCSPATSS